MLFDSRAWLWLALALTALKLWLTRGQRLYAIGNAAHDDRLFADLAGYLVEGQWLGPYNQLTLAKGPLYSLFIAGNFWTGLPLGLTQQLLYALACAAVVAALRPWLRWRVLLFVAYALLLWNPMSFEAGNLARLMRQNLATPLALFAVAGLIAVHADRNRGWPRQLAWAALAGLAFGGFWITREESIWLAPAVAGLAGAHLFISWREARLKRAVAAVTFTLALALAPSLVVSQLNARHYGWFGTVEFRAAEFQAAYGALSRIRVGADKPMVPVTREMRHAAYAVSPAFAELQPFLEGDIGLNWAEKQQFRAEEREIRGGWFMWALRDAAAAAGRANSAGEAMEFYQRIADEVNRACDSGAVPAGAPRSGFLPELPRTLWPKLAAGARLFARYFVTFDGFNVRSPPSIGDYAELRPFRDFTRERVSAAPRSPDLVTPEQDEQMELKLRWIENVARWSAGVLTALALLAHALVALRLVESIARRQFSFLLAAALAVWLACAACVAINMLVHVTSFPNLTPAAMASAYPLLILFSLLALVEAGAAWGPRLLRRRTS